ALALSTPVLAEGWIGNRLLGLVAGAVIVAGLYAARPGWRSLKVGLILAVIDFGMGWLVYLLNHRWLIVLQASLWLATQTYVAILILETVFEKTKVDLETLQASLCVFLIFGVIWSYLFSVIELTTPGSFRLSDGSQIEWANSRSRRDGVVRLF